MKKNVLLFAVLMLFVSFNTVTAKPANDVEGAKDYPLVSRFKGSVIAWYQNKSFEKYYLLDLKDNKLAPKILEGKISRIQYVADKNHSTYEIQKAYESALKNAGFNVTLVLNENNGPSNLNEELYIGEFNGLNQLPARESIKPDHNGKWSYVEAVGQFQGIDIAVVVYIAGQEEPLIIFDAVETAGLEKGLVTATNIDKGITDAGHAVLDGVYFDTGKATIKNQSSAALKNIADYLGSHTDRKYFIVGHTDNQGSFKSNMKLSEDRANAVMNMLITKYGVKKSQLSAYGAANLMPVAGNSDDIGRARNRRVEIVEQ